MSSGQILCDVRIVDLEEGGHLLRVYMEERISRLRSLLLSCVQGLFALSPSCFLPQTPLGGRWNCTAFWSTTRDTGGSDAGGSVPNSLLPKALAYIYEC